MIDKNQLKQDMIAWRHHLHEHPELARQESGTAKFVAARLAEMPNLDVVTGIGGHGIVATLKGAGEGPTIGIRADMDCIAMTEETGLPYASRTEKKMHACGHDGHTTMLLGAAALLSADPSFNGTVRFLFQPGEEPGWGAKDMVDDGLFERFPCDEVYGLHNSPVLPFGRIETKVGGMNAAEDNFTIKINGRGGHASRPQNTVDPLACFAEIYLALQTIVSRNATPTNAVVVSCTEVECDGVHNAIPSHVVVRGDARTYNLEDSALIEARMREICEHVCAMNGATCEVTYTHEFLPVINNKTCVGKVVDAARKYFGAENVNDDCPASTGSEDFSYFANCVPGCFFNLGTARPDAENFPLHNPHYDFNDDALEVGASFWDFFARELLK